MEDEPQASSGNDERTEQDGQAKEQGTPVLASVDPQPKPIVEVASGQPGQPNSHEQNEAKRQKTLERSTVVQGWCAVAIAFFTLAQVIVGYWQWDATNKQYRVMGDQLEAEQRPWVSITRADVTLDAAKPVYGFVMQNDGKTPAKLGTISFELFAMQKAADPVNIIRNENGWHHKAYWGVNLAPGQELGRVNLDLKVPKDEIRNIKSGDSNLYFAIRVVYSGLSGRDYSTRRNFVYYPDTKSFGHYGKQDQMD